MGHGRAGGDAELAQEGLAREMRHQPARLADAEVDRRLAEIVRHELRMQVGDMQDRHLSQRIEAQQFILREPLLRRQTAERRADDRRRGDGCLSELAT